MKAIVCPRYGPPDVLQLTDVPKPVPKDNEIRIRVRATTVTVADFRIRSFTIPPSFWLPARLILGITRPKQPILGVELAGDVETVGAAVTTFKPGDQVFAATLMQMGAYAEYICVPANGPIALKPSHSTYEEAAALPVGACTALHYLQKAKITRGQNVLVYGASGSVGTYAVQLAKQMGAEVTGVCSAANAALVQSLGASQVLDYTAPDFLQKLDTYDVVFVAIDKLPFSICNRILKEEGVYLNVTTPLKTPHMLWVSLTTRKKIHTGENTIESAEDLHFLRTLIENGQLTPVIDRVYPFAQMVEAHRYVEQGHKKGNVAITL